MDECPSLGDTSSRIDSFDPFAIPGESKIACEDYEECVGNGKAVAIPGIAFVTYVERRNLVNIPLTAVVDSKLSWYMHLYTDVIDLAPFGSPENRRPGPWSTETNRPLK